MLYLDLLLSNLEGEFEILEDVDLGSALKGDLSLGSQETLVDRVRKLDRDQGLDRNVAEVVIESRCVEPVDLCFDLDLAILVERCRKALCHVL